MWKIELTELAQKNIEALEKPVQKKIIEFLHKLEFVDDPRISGHPLRGNKLDSYWTYKVMKNYRIIAKIQDKELVIFVVSAGNRKTIYAKLERLL